MRELNLDEIELVSGGYTPGTDGPSVEALNLVALTSANGVVLGGAAGVVTGTYLGVSGVALMQGVSTSAAIGGIYGGAFGIGLSAGMVFNDLYERTTGTTVGESIYRALH